MVTTMLRNTLYNVYCVFVFCWVAALLYVACRHSSNMFFHQHPTAMARALISLGKTAAFASNVAVVTTVRFNSATHTTGLTWFYGSQFMFYLFQLSLFVALKQLRSTIHHAGNTKTVKKAEVVERTRNGVVGVLGAAAAAQLVAWVIIYAYDHFSSDRLRRAAVGLQAFTFAWSFLVEFFAYGWYKCRYSVPYFSAKQHKAPPAPEGNDGGVESKA